jgi:hypothetical protein
MPSVPGTIARLLRLMFLVGDVDESLAPKNRSSAPSTAMKI